MSKSSDSNSSSEENTIDLDKLVLDEKSPGHQKTEEYLLGLKSPEDMVEGRKDGAPNTTFQKPRENSWVNEDESKKARKVKKAASLV